MPVTVKYVNIKYNFKFRAYIGSYMNIQRKKFLPWPELGHGYLDVGYVLVCNVLHFPS